MQGKCIRNPLECQYVRFTSDPEVLKLVIGWAHQAKQATRYDHTTGMLYIGIPDGGTVGIPVGHVVIRDPEGEVYSISERKFKKLYSVQ